MKVSKNWLKELVAIKDMNQLVDLLPLRTIATKEVTENFIELDMKGYNRADLLSLRGIAYEVATITDFRVNFEEPKESEYIWAEKNLNSTPVSIEDEELCEVQAVAKIEGLKVEQSSNAWVKKLNDSGMRSIDNITDITNLVMLEYGHPLHAFDSETVEDETINVRRAKDGEEITTLDGKLRKLTKSDLVLADTSKALDVAGVMGGKDTEIKETTQTILLSASLFNPKTIRRTSSRLKFSSEASKRFYHGLTKKRLFQALDRAIRMYQELGGKLTGLTIVGDNEDHIKKVPLSLRKVNELIGVELKKEKVEDYLKKLHFELLEEKNAEGEPAWVVTPPYWRLDIEIEEDLVEEVARMYGYEKIPAKPLEGKLPEKIDQSFFELIHKLKQKLVETGLTEVQTYSFYSTKVLDAIMFNDISKKDLVKVTNPMSAETQYMRINIWPNLVEVIDKNIRQGFEDIAIFEIGKEYLPEQDGKPLENTTLAIALMNGSENPLDEMNQIFKSITSIMGTTGITGEISMEPTEVPDMFKNLFHPNRFLKFEKGDQDMGGMAEVHLKVLDKMGISKRVAILQINLDGLVS